MREGGRLGGESCIVERDVSVQILLHAASEGETTGLDTEAVQGRERDLRGGREGDAPRSNERLRTARARSASSSLPLPRTRRCALSAMLCASERSSFSSPSPLAAPLACCICCLVGEPCICLGAAVSSCWTGDEAALGDEADEVARCLPLPFFEGDGLLGEPDVMPGIVREVTRVRASCAEWWTARGPGSRACFSSPRRGDNSETRSLVCAVRQREQSMQCHIT